MHPPRFPLPVHHPESVLARLTSAAALVLILLLAACGGDDDAAPSAGSGTPGLSGCTTSCSATSAECKTQNPSCVRQCQDKLAQITSATGSSDCAKANDAYVACVNASPQRKVLCDADSLGLQPTSDCGAKLDAVNCACLDLC